MMSGLRAITGLDPSEVVWKLNEKFIGKTGQMLQKGTTERVGLGTLTSIYTDRKQEIDPTIIFEFGPKLVVFELKTKKTTMQDSGTEHTEVYVGGTLLSKAVGDVVSSLSW